MLLHGKTHLNATGSGVQFIDTLMVDGGNEKGEELISLDDDC